MANNFKYSGKRITLKNLSAAVAAGSLIRRAGFIGIPMSHAAAGASCAFALEGVWGMTFSAYGAYQPPVGTILYWDTSAPGLSIGSATDDFPAVKVITAVSATDGSFDGLLLPMANGRAVGLDQQ